MTASHDPLISVIVPTWNCAAYVGETLESIVSQEYGRKEIIVVDGASDDGTQAEIERYRKWLKVFISEKDSGQTDAINKGFRHASGELVNWLNGDDCYVPGALAAIADAWRPDTTMVAGHVRHFIEGDDTTTWLERTAWYADPARTAANEVNRQPGTFFARSVLSRVFPLEARFRFVMDQEMWIKIVLACGTSRFVSTDAIVCRFRRHPASKSMANGDEYRIGFSEAFFREYNSLFAGLAVVAGRASLARFLAEELPSDPALIASVAGSMPSLGVQGATIDRCLDWYVHAFVQNLDTKGEFGEAKALARAGGWFPETVGWKAFGRARLRLAASALIRYKRAARV
jgi:glycosyltransferase involved in cell wall biosynthesis